MLHSKSGSGPNARDGGRRSEGEPARKLPDTAGQVRVDRGQFQSAGTGPHCIREEKMSNSIMDEDETRNSWNPSLHPLYVERARSLQARAIAGLMTKLGRFLLGCPPRGVHGVVNAVRKRRTITELARLDDHTLSDIGVERARIPEIVQGLNAHRDTASPNAVTTASPNAVTTAPDGPSDRSDAARCEEPYRMAA